jgi:adenine-specific DNA-methyltransferase
LQENKKEYTEIDKLYPYEDEVGKYRLDDFIRLGGGNASLRVSKPVCFYPIYVSKDLSKISIEKIENSFEVLPITNSGQERTWKLIKESAQNKIDQSEIVVIKENDRIYLKEKYRVDKGTPITTQWINPRYNAKTYGTDYLKNISLSELFAYPKSIELMKDIIRIVSNGNDIILDFFGGCGTTAHAVLELNKEDGGNRQFIICEQMDYIETVTVERVKKAIQQDNKSDFVYLELKKYNEIFMEKIEDAQSTETLLAIWGQMKEHSFLVYNVDLKKQEAEIESFSALDIKEQKEVLCSLLDKNMLYIPLSLLDDAEFGCSLSEKGWTKDFYNIREEDV